MAAAGGGDNSTAVANCSEKMASLGPELVRRFAKGLNCFVTVRKMYETRMQR